MCLDYRQEDVKDSAESAGFALQDVAQKLRHRHFAIARPVWGLPISLANSSLLLREPATWATGCSPEPCSKAPRPLPERPFRAGSAAGNDARKPHHHRAEPQAVQGCGLREHIRGGRADAHRPSPPPPMPTAIRDTPAPSNTSFSHALLVRCRWWKSESARLPFKISASPCGEFLEGNR